MSAKSILIKNGCIWNGNTFVDGGIAVENGKISKIGQVENMTADYTFDASGAIISHGLIDIHTHMRNISSYDFGIQAEIACFPFGVTFAADASCTAQASREVLDSFLIKNAVFLSAYYCDGKLDTKLMDTLVDRFKGKAVGIKVFFDKGLSNVTLENLREVCGYARKNALKVMVHSTNPPVSMRQLLGCLSKGDLCTHIFHGAGYNVADDNFESLIEAKNKGIILDLGMAGSMHTNFKIARQAIKQGILPDTISTDITNCSAFTRGGRYGMTMVMTIMQLLGMSEIEIFKAVTVNAAAALNIGGNFGVLREGNLADITVIDYSKAQINLLDKAGNNLKAEKGYDCLLTIIDGHVVYAK